MLLYMYHNLPKITKNTGFIAIKNKSGSNFVFRSLEFV